MLLQQFLNKLGNPKPIILSNHNIRIGLDAVSSYNAKTELHFIPNIGGLKSQEIKQTKAVFIDLDCGKDENNFYFSLEIVKEYKEQKLKELSSFSVSPSAIIETRNGLQVYWFLNENLSVNKWNIIENYLVNYFSADVQVKSISNQMRLPETYWVKDVENKFFCKTLELNNNRYSYKDFCSVISASAQDNTSNDTEYIISEKIIYTSYQSIFFHLTREVDLFEYLKEYYNLDAKSRKSFKCICHNDKNPSANIFKTNAGVWLYSCRSDSCTFKIGNIIQFVAFKENISRHKAIRVICDNLNIKYEENQEHKLLLEDNLHTLQDIEYSHNDLYKAVKRYIRTLVLLHYIAIDNIEYTSENNGFVFSGSTRYLADILGRNDKKTTIEDINYLSLLELIKKVDINSVSTQYKTMILKYQADNNQYKHINLYSIPIYNQISLNKSNDIAKIIKEKNMKKRDFSYETVANAFGPEKANNIYPQTKNKAVKPIDTRITDAIEQSLENRDYFSLQSVKEYFNCIGWSFFEKRYIRQLPKLIEIFNVEKIKTNKEVKEKYQICSNGYPYIYVKKQG